MEVTSLNYMPLVRINAPEWFGRADWKIWLQYTGAGHPATWHTPSQEHAESDDVFFTFYQGGDGSDSPEYGIRPAIPSDIWEEICELMKANGIKECLIWVSNLDGE